MSKAMDIVFDGPPGPQSGRFIEVESPPGTSIKLGEWIELPPYWVLRFEVGKFNWRSYWLGIGTVFAFIVAALVLVNIL